MEINELLTILSSILVLFNGAQVGIAAWKKLKPEVKKMEREAEHELQEAANLNLEGAEKSISFLMETVKTLKGDLEVEKKARQEDAIYFRRRIKEIDREARDYRAWAAKLAKQLIEAGKIPEPFVPTTDESDPMIQALEKERKQLKAVTEQRKKDVEEAKNDR